MFELRKIGIVKRASALLLDAILLAVLTTGFMWIISLIANFSSKQELAVQYYNEWEDFRIEYFPSVAPFYGFDYEQNEDGTEFTLTMNGVPKTEDDVVRALNSSDGNDPETAEAYQKFLTLTPRNKVDAQYLLVYSTLFMMISLGLLLAYLVLEFILPIILKNGQTVGKKVFGICLVRSDCVKITNISLFARSILGKFAVETMFPVLLVFLFFFGGLGVLAIILFAALMILNIVLFFATKNRTPIHDIFAATVAVDMKLQMIYESEEELAMKKAAQHKQFIENSKS